MCYLGDVDQKRILNDQDSFLSFSENLDSGACQVKNLKREKLSDFLGLTDIFSVKNVVTN